MKAIYVVIYLIIMNLITFFAMYLDKRKAKKGKWRIQESTLFILAALRRSNRWINRNEKIQT